MPQGRCAGTVPPSASGVFSCTASTTGSRSPSRRGDSVAGGVSGAVRDHSERRSDPPARRSGRAASTASSSPAGTIRARGCRSCSGPGPRSAAARARACGSSAPTRSPSACSRPPARARRRHRRARPPLPGAPDRGAAVRESADRAVRRDGELRHGAGTRARVRAPGCGVRHRGVSERHDLGDRAARCRLATWTRSSARSQALLADEPRRRARAPPAAGSRWSATRGTGSPRASSASTTASRKHGRPRARGRREAA